MLEKESTNFIMIFLIMTFLNTPYDAKHKATKERGLKILKILAHVKTGNNSNLWKKSDKLFILCINQKKNYQKGIQ